MAEEVLPIFVYGTLQRGEERAAKWPHTPLRILPATIRGRLRDLGPYPALVEGEGIVRGELWEIAETHFKETLRVLDEIECFGNEGVDLYVRRVVKCRTDDGRRGRAYTYFFADPRAIASAPYVQPGEQGWAHWRRQP